MFYVPVHFLSVPSSYLACIAKVIFKSKAHCKRGDAENCCHATEGSHENNDA